VTSGLLACVQAWPQIEDLRENGRLYLDRRVRVLCFTANAPADNDNELVSGEPSLEASDKQVLGRAVAIKRITVEPDFAKARIKWSAVGVYLHR